MRDGFVFYRSFAEALKEVDQQTKAEVVDMLCAYALDGIEPDASGIALALFTLMKPQIDANNKRFENGKKGGRPKTEEEPNDNQTETKQKPNDNQTITKAEPKEKDKEKDKEKEKVKRHKYGEYSHVLLTDEEYYRLCQEHGELIVNKAIKVVDEYCQTSGKTYKDYNLVLRKWGIDRAKNGDSRGSPYLDAIKNRVSVVDSWL